MSANIRMLVTQIVDQRLSYLEAGWMNFLAPVEDYGASDPFVDWQTLVDALEAAAKAEAVARRLDPDAEELHIECGAQAGFLVGLELGRRLAGGAR